MRLSRRLRAIDTIEPKDIKGSGFVVRKYSSIKFVYRLFLMLMVIAVGAGLLFFNNAWFGSIMCVIVGSITLDLGRNIERQQKSIETGEFMNALFSSALGHKYTFCTLVRLDGKIVYMNRPFQALFPEFVNQPQHDLETLLTMANVAPDLRQNVISLVTGNTDNAVTVTMELGQDKAPQTLVLHVEPVERPTGFVLLRATQDANV